MVCGYRRRDGRVGVRNHVAIIPTAVSTASLATAIADGLGGWAHATPHQMGAYAPTGSQQQTERTLVGFGRHPNVGAAVVVDHGTEALSATDIAARIEEDGTPVRTATVREAGGSQQALTRGQSLATALHDEIIETERVDVGLDQLVVGVACSNSDATSGLATNAAIGAVSDRLVAAGATVVMGETAEFIGAEHILTSRCEHRAVGERITRYSEYRDRIARRMGVDLTAVRPTKPHRCGGLSTIEEVSFGAVQKAGTAPIEVMFPYAYQLPVGRGLVLMDTPTHDIESVIGQVAGGVQLLIRSTGQGCPPGNPIAPVITTTANSSTARRLSDHVDVDISDLLGALDPVAAAEQLFDHIVAVANGRPTAAERLSLDACAVNEVQPEQLAGTGTFA